MSRARTPREGTTITKSWSAAPARGPFAEPANETSCARSNNVREAFLNSARKATPQQAHLYAEVLAHLGQDRPAVGSLLCRRPQDATVRALLFSGIIFSGSEVWDFRSVRGIDSDRLTINLTFWDNFQRNTAITDQKRTKKMPSSRFGGGAPARGTPFGVLTGILFRFVQRHFERMPMLLVIYIRLRDC